MNEITLKLSVKEITKVAMTALTAAGVPVDNAETQLQLLLDAEIRGVKSHGLLRLPRVIERINHGVSNPDTKGLAKWKTSAFLDVDGQNGMGPVVALETLNMLCDRAESIGVAVGAIRNCDHLGMMAWYAEQIANRGFILIALTISEALVHPTGGTKAMIGTNPIAIGVPANPYPFVLDMATSEVSMGKIHDYANHDREIPNGWAVDSSGHPTNSAIKAKDGALSSFGGAKGYGLGLGFELLVTAMAGSAIGIDVVGTLDNDKHCNKGDLFIVMKPMGGAVSLIDNYLDSIRNCLPVDPNNPVRIPGDRARELIKQKNNDYINVSKFVWEQILQLKNV